ncbi:hypothetical protein Sta7437_2625 [Stanieria cyanosphaera PCC 7437]|uniref:Uncharacterized protein n=2 Tax=Stanieria cyanosphaera TaxID=102116 RepID=K9XVP4_STAC7|nr:hypothetical protein Sta7437_2625 [Stanieria cyanosphaera PCC 7437]
MGMIISISCIPQKHKVVQAYAALVRRLTVDNPSPEIKRHQITWSYDSERLDLATLMNILESSDAESLAEGNEGFSVDTGYQLLSGEWIGISIYLSGKLYKNGLDVRYLGSLQITTEYSDLYHSVKLKPRFKNKAANENNPKFSWGYEGMKPVLNQKLIQANQSADALFLTACGLLEPEDNSYIDHAAMYYRYGWLSPLTNPMIYHRNPVEFARDFERIYAEYHYGISIPLLLNSGIDIWQLTQAEITDLVTYLGKTDSPVKNYPKTYKLLCKPHDILPEQKESDIINFVESLDPETVKKLSKLSPDFIKQALANLEQELPEIHSYDFESRGIVLTSGVLMSVWRAYQYLAQLAALELGK